MTKDSIAKPRRSANELKLEKRVEALEKQVITYKGVVTRLKKSRDRWEKKYEGAALRRSRVRGTSKSYQELLAEIAQYRKRLKKVNQWLVGKDEYEPGANVTGEGVLAELTALQNPILTLVDTCGLANTAGDRLAFEIYLHDCLINRVKRLLRFYNPEICQGRNGQYLRIYQNKRKMFLFLRKHNLLTPMALEFCKPYLAQEYVQDENLAREAADQINKKLEKRRKLR